MGKHLHLTKEEIIYTVRQFYDTNNRAPLLKEVKNLPFSKKRVVSLFGTWNHMLLYAGVPLNRNPPRIVHCALCDEKFMKQVKEIKKCVNHFCSSTCNARFYMTGRIHSEETKQKISESLKAHRIF